MHHKKIMGRRKKKESNPNETRGPLGTHGMLAGQAKAAGQATLVPAGHSATGAGTMGVVAQPAAAPGGQVASTPDVPAGSAAPPIKPAVPMPPLVSTLPSNGSLYSRSAEPRAQQVLVQQTLRPTAGVGAAAAAPGSHKMPSKLELLLQSRTKVFVGRNIQGEIREMSGAAAAARR